MPSHAREHCTPAVAQPGRKARGGGATAKSFDAIGGLLEEAENQGKEQVNSTESLGNGVGQFKVVRLFTEPHAKKQGRLVPVSEPRQKAAQGKGKAKVSPPKVEDTASPTKVKIPVPSIYGEEVASVPPDTYTKSVMKTNELGESQFGSCIMCGKKIFSAVGSWQVPLAYLGENGKFNNLIAGAKLVTGYTCSAKCEQDKEDSQPSFLDQNIATVKVTCFNGKKFVPSTEGK